MSRRVSKDPKFIEIVALGAALRYPEARILQELEKEGFNVSRNTVVKVKHNLRDNLVNDVNDAFEFGILQEHFTAIKAIKEGQRILWEQIEKEQDPQTKSNIVMQVLQTYQYLSAYYLNIKRVMGQHKIIQIPKDIITT